MNSLKKTYETELANELGNLLSRVLSMIQKYRPGYQKDVAAKVFHGDSQNIFTITNIPEGSGVNKKKILETFDGLYDKLDFYNILSGHLLLLLCAENIF